MTKDSLTEWKRPLRYVMGLMYVATGIGHFLAPDLCEQAVPPQFPRPRLLVYLSGLAEIALGAGVLFERTRTRSAWGLVALLVAVFPANLYMASSDEFTLDGVPAAFREPPDAALWARLPFQAVLIAWAWWYTNPEDSALPEQ